MSMLDFVNGAREFLKNLDIMRMPAMIEEPFPTGHPAAGTIAGRYLLKRGLNGTAEYEWNGLPMGADRGEAQAELEMHHAFTDLDSFVRWLGDPRPTLLVPSVFVHVPPFESALLLGLDQEHPEAGTVTMEVRRHPAWLRWSSVAGKGEHEDLTHVQLADLLLDNAEDLEQPELAKYLAAFRGARSIEYVADYDTGSEMGVKLAWGGGSGAKTTNMKVPRDFNASVPAFVGAWAPGGEPRHVATFRLRVIPPRDADEAAPTFRILWVNALDFEIEAATALYNAVSGALAGKDPTYLGTPNAKRFVVPKAPPGA